MDTYNKSELLIGTINAYKTRKKVEYMLAILNELLEDGEKLYIEKQDGTCIKVDGAIKNIHNYKIVATNS